jgi:hypothetical protein
MEIEENTDNVDVETENPTQTGNSHPQNNININDEGEV